jgi:uracil-DNA glycosylase
MNRAILGSAIDVEQPLLKNGCIQLQAFKPLHQVPYLKSHLLRLILMNTSFDPDCRACPRLANFMDDVRVLNPDYHCRPVAPLGDEDAQVLVVGLAPGMHGANATGRPFTGDYAGNLLYETLHKYGFANKAESIAVGDGLKLSGLRITNAVKCLPPANKPTTEEVKTCNKFLQSELGIGKYIDTNERKDIAKKGAHKRAQIILCLGSISHQAVLRAFGLKLKDYRFGHANEYVLPSGQLLLDSYHCSRYNTNTKRLTPEMFYQVFARAREIIESN